MDHNQLRSFLCHDIGPRGMGGGFSPDIIIFDEADRYDKRMKDIVGPTFVISDHCRPYYEETYSVRHDLMCKKPTYKAGETPRGTKPSFIGGIKKTKQQRAVTKARRKQR